MFCSAPILIAEDNFYIAMDLSNAVEEMDGHVVGPASSLNEALDLLGSTAVVAAVVDCELCERDSAPLMRALAERCIPFVVHTASPLRQLIAELHPEVPVLVKPLQPQVVLNCLVGEIGKAAPDAAAKEPAVT